MEPENAQCPNSTGLQGSSVLVVEDGWQVANELKLSLEKLGMVVTGPVATATEARDLAAAHSPDFAIVDVNLRGEMTYALMDSLHDRGTRVIVITGYGSLPVSVKKFAAILHKPFTAAALQKTLLRTLD